MRRGTQVALSVLGVALLGAATNVATGILPSAWKSYLWLAWPAIGILIIVLIILEIAAQRRPTGQPQRHHPVMARSILIRRVRSFWIQGVLERSLYHEARIELDLAAAVEGGHHPWEVIASRPNGAVVEFPAGTDVKKMFEEFDRTIVITGDPGSGKTTMLLDLAQCLLEEAAADEDKQVPVVLPLSSWATHRKPIAEWVSDQLVSQYGMPQQLASDWVSDQVIIPLFDGLDEVPEEVREGCMTAIRDYHRTHGLSGGVLCCRGNEYNALRERLDRNGVLAIQPLSRGQVERYLHSAGPALEGVRAALVSDPGLWDLAESPLLLSIMALAYQNGHGTLETTSPDDRQHNLFAQYVRTMLQRRESPRYPLELSTKYLTTLAWELRNTNQTVFALDMISSRWAFPPAELDVPARTISTILCGLIMLGAGLILSGWQAGVVACIFAAVFVAQNLSRTDYDDLGYITYGVRRDSDPTKPLGTSPNWWLEWTLGLLFTLYESFEDARQSLITLILIILTSVVIALFSPRDVAVAYAIGLFAAILVMLGAALVAMFNAEYVERHLARVRHEVPSPALRVRLVFASRVAVVTAVISGIIAGWSASLAPMSILPPARFGALIGIFAILLVIFSVAGGPIIEQFLTRLYLRHHDAVPWPCHPFFDYMTECLLLRPVGAGYIFVHKELMDFIAEQWPSGDFALPTVGAPARRDASSSDD